MSDDTDAARDRRDDQDRSPTSDPPDASPLRRRTLLGVLGTAGTVGLTGCLGGDGDGSDGDGSDGDGSEEDGFGEDGSGGNGDGSSGDGSGDGDGSSESATGLSDGELWGTAHDFDLPPAGTGVLEVDGETFEFQTNSCHAFSDRIWPHKLFEGMAFGSGTWDGREFDVQATRQILDDGWEDETLLLNVEWEDPDQSGGGPVVSDATLLELPERAQGDQPLIRVDRDAGVFTADGELTGQTTGADEVPGGDATLVVNCHTLLSSWDSRVWFDGRELRHDDVADGEDEETVGIVQCAGLNRDTDEEFEAHFDYDDVTLVLTVEYDEENEAVERTELAAFDRSFGTFEQTDPDELVDVEYVPTSHTEGSVGLEPADETAEEATPDGHEIEFELYCT